MKKTFAITLFMLATLAWAMAQQPGSMPGQNSGQVTSPSSQTPAESAGQSTSPASQAPDAAPQAPGASTSPTSGATPKVTEGCLGGSNPNYTVTDASGTTYKLNIPPNADTSKLAAHVGESVDVAGNVNGMGAGSSINVQGIGKGTGTCPAGAKNSPNPQK